MARRNARTETRRPDLEIQLPDGRIMAIEVKESRSGVAVRDLTGQALMHVSRASAAWVGAASVFGWYVRSGAPWSSGAEEAVHNDWQTVGDDLWRAAGQFRSVKSATDDDQPHLFDPSEYAKSRH